MGHSRKIGRAAKMGWEKILSPAIVAGHYMIWRHGSDFIYTKNSARPGSGFYLHKLFRGLFGKKLLRKMTDAVYIELLNPSIPKAKMYEMLLSV